MFLATSILLLSQTCSSFKESHLLKLLGVIDCKYTCLQIINQGDVYFMFAFSLRANGVEIMLTMDAMDSFSVILCTV